jgi:hypothetical protein
MSLSRSARIPAAVATLAAITGSVVIAIAAPAVSVTSFADGGGSGQTTPPPPPPGDGHPWEG